MPTTKPMRYIHFTNGSYNSVYFFQNTSTDFVVNNPYPFFISVIRQKFSKLKKKTEKKVSITVDG